MYRYERVNSFYEYSPFDSESYRKAAAAIDFSDDRRRALVDALGIHNAGSPALEALARPGTVAVLTGQQVGLFSGPAYTIYKALTAAKLAHRLSEQGIPAVPVFWLATEDHDFAEVDHCWVFDPSRRPVRLSAEGDGEANQPVGGVRLTESPTGQLRAALSGLPFAEEVSALVEKAYRPGVTFGEAFRLLLRSILPAYDLLYLDPMLPEMRALAAPLLSSAVRAAPELTEGLLARTRELEQQGYHGQVHVEADSSLVFLLDGKRRTPLRRHGLEYATNGRRFTTSELAERAGDLSPNALLRPVVQDSMLPTVAYVGGPAELAYLAQSQVLYKKLLQRMPVAISRAGFTLIDHHGRKCMNRYQLGLEDAFHGFDVLRERMARSLTPPELKARLARTRDTVSEALDQLGGAMAAFDPTLAAAFAKSRLKMAYQLEKTERKVGLEALRRDARASLDATYISGLLYPEKHVQERLYSVLPFLAHSGLDFISALYENIRLDCPDHQMLFV